MSASVWNGALDKVVLPAGAAGQVTPAFSAPNNALGVLIYIPQLTASVAVKIQALAPKDGDQDADVWQDLSTGLTNNAGAIQVSTVSALGSSSADIAYGFDAGVLGSGVFRFISTGAGSQASAVTIRIAWRVDHDRH